MEVTALKRSEEAEELVVRLLNEFDVRATCRLRPYLPAASARRLTIGEDPIEDGRLAVDDGWIALQLRPWEIATVGIGLER